MILCVGLSPTVQRTMGFSNPVESGRVVRASWVKTTASGKAVNVARMVSQLGAETHLIHPLAGETGILVNRMLDEDRVRQTVIWLEKTLTRICTTVLDGETTELVEEASPLQPLDLQRLETCVEEAVAECTLQCLCGSFPAGVQTIWFRDRVVAAKQQGVPTLVDAQSEVLRHCLDAGPWLVKPNRMEANVALGMDPAMSADIAARALVAAGANNALVSDGAAGAVFYGSGTLLRISAPRVDVVNPIGSGDALAAGIAAAWSAGVREWPTLLKHAAAAAAANCRTQTSGVLNREDADRYLGQVVVTESN